LQGLIVDLHRLFVGRDGLAGRLGLLVFGQLGGGLGGGGLVGFRRGLIGGQRRTGR
jgi:hypothetical protein